jgi:cell division protein FtsB
MFARVYQRLGGGFSADIAAAFPLGQVGGSMNPQQARRYERQQARDIDRAIDDAIRAQKLTAQIATLKRKIAALDTPPQPTRAKRARSERVMSEREQAVYQWYFYGGADEAPPDGLTDQELMGYRAMWG